MRKLLLYTVCFFSSFIAKSQLSQVGTPMMLLQNELLTSIPDQVFSSVDLQSLKAEDKVTDIHKDVPWRFGIALDANIQSTKHGRWTNLPNGNVWHMSIKALGAKSINVNYNYFNIPEGAKFYLYGKNSGEILGAFTHQNVKQNFEFATGIIHDEEIILEYFEPYNASFKGEISISSVVYGYRSIEKSALGFGDSGNCNINIKCHPEWSEEAAAVAMILTANNTRICTGALVNNTKQDKKPFFLTANHCNPSSNNIFMFNYESPDCNNDIDGNLSQTIQGCTVLAKAAPSDFALLLLSETPPESYNVSYAGWSAENIAPTNGTGIHHPSGDIKKISFNNKPLIADADYGNSHWRTTYWDEGTTEAGSSGSPIFDQNRRIVGQLHGGLAACGNAEYDSYGSFFYSWDSNPDSSAQLKYWLAPDTTGVTKLDILSNLQPQHNLDLSIIALNNVSTFSCGENISPVLNVRNFGQTSISNIALICVVDGDTSFKSIDFPIPIQSLKYRDIVLPEIDLSASTTGFIDIDFQIISVNGLVDEDTSNDTIQHTLFYNKNPKPVTLKVKYDDWPGEISWTLRDKDNPTHIIESELSGGKNETKQRSVCTYKGCYILDIYDSQGDGFCCDFGNGSLLIFDDEDTLVFDNTFDGDMVSYEFCVGQVGTEEFIQEKDITISPNPSKGYFDINYGQWELIESISLYDMRGAIIKDLPLTPQQVISDLAPGVYLLYIKGSNGNVGKRLIIN